MSSGSPMSSGGSRMRFIHVIRRVLVIVCLVAPLSVPGVGSAATIGGTTCQREGRSRQAADTKFVCKRSKNGRLRWRLQSTKPIGDPNLIVDNGYINLDGVRVSSIAGYGKYGMDIVEKCGRISDMVVKIWFKYADGRISDERWRFNGKQVNVFRTDEDGRPAWRPVYVEASGLDPYGEGWTEEHGFPPTEWIWCANRPPINQ